LSLKGDEQDTLRDIRNANRAGKQEDAVAKAENSENPMEGPGEHQNGQNGLDYFALGTISMCPMIRSSIVASPLSTMTPRLQGAPGIEKP
jgi:hypothetical protein